MLLFAKLENLLLPLFGIPNADSFLHLGLQTEDIEGKLKLAGLSITHIPQSFSIQWPEMNISCYSMILIKGFVCFCFYFQLQEKFLSKLLLSIRFSLASTIP